MKKRYAQGGVPSMTTRRRGYTSPYKYQQGPMPPQGQPQEPPMEGPQGPPQGPPPEQGGEMSPEMKQMADKAMEMSLQEIMDMIAQIEQAMQQDPAKAKEYQEVLAVLQQVAEIKQQEEGGQQLAQEGAPQPGMEGAPAGPPMEGGQPSPEEMAMMEQQMMAQQGAPQGPPMARNGARMPMYQRGNQYTRSPQDLARQMQQERVWGQENERAAARAKHWDVRRYEATPEIDERYERATLSKNLGMPNPGYAPTYMETPPVSLPSDTPISEYRNGGRPMYQRGVHQLPSEKQVTGLMQRSLPMASTQGALQRQLMPMYRQLLSENVAEHERRREQGWPNAQPEYRQPEGEMEWKRYGGSMYQCGGMMPRRASAAPYRRGGAMPYQQGGGINPYQQMIIDNMPVYRG